MSALYDKVIKALAEHARRVEVVRIMDDGDREVQDVLKRRIKLHPMDWTALKDELGTTDENGKLWTPGSWLLGVDVATDESVPLGEVLLETIVWEWIQ